MPSGWQKLPLLTLSIILCTALLKPITLQARGKVQSSEFIQGTRNLFPGEEGIDIHLAARCNFKGAFIEGDCYCSAEFYGPFCSESVAEYEQLAGLPAESGKRTNWNHYLHDSFKSRHVLAAAYFDSCQRVIEVGAYKTPITLFMRDSHRVRLVTAVDPLVSSAHFHGRNPSQVFRHLKQRLLDYDFRAHNEDCFLWMGLPDSNHISDAEEQVLKEAFNTKNVIVLEYAVDWGHGEITYQRLKAVVPTSLKVTLSITLDLSENSFPASSHRPLTKRRVVVFVRDGYSVEGRTPLLPSVW